MIRGLPMRSSFISRRQMLGCFGLAAAGVMEIKDEPGLAADGANPPLILAIERQTLWQGRDGGVTWFHPRACIVREKAGSFALMTLQSISGSDYFGPVHWTESRDVGRSWSRPRPVPGLGRKPAADGAEEGVCDVVPEFHAATGTVLAIGQQVFYRSGKLMTPQPMRAPIYVVRGVDGQWSPPQRLDWVDPRASYLYSANCAQRITLDGGDVLIPVCFGKSDRARSATALRCSFDGKQLALKDVGTELKMNKGRGFLEPSLALLDGVYYMTIRAEDGHGYVSKSADGLKWETSVPWQWDNGEPLTMSTTQQRWLPHSNALFLVYTRKAVENTDVMRWRAPLYLAEVDRTTMRLRRDTEQVVFPLRGDGVRDGKHVAHYGNFHTTAASPDESWITSGEVIPANFRGDTLLARVTWSKPNKLVAANTIADHFGLRDRWVKRAPAAD
jgi:hypothetical protein